MMSSSHILLTLTTALVFWMLLSVIRFYPVTFCAIVDLKPSVAILGGDNETNNKEQIVVDESSSRSPLPPLVLISRGCSGSTFLIEFAQRLVKRHTGLDAYVGFHEHEYLKKRAKVYNTTNPWFNFTLARTNPFLADKQMVLDVHERISQNVSQAMIPKVLQAHFTEGVAAGLEELSARFVVTYRRNLLEKKICSIRDCFNRVEHTTVFQNGTTSSLCFERRVRPEIKTFALVDKKSFSKFMTTQMRDWGCEEALHEPSLKKHIDSVLVNASYPMVALESLEAFEYTQKNSLDFNESLAAWKTFLWGWGIEPQEELVVEEMRIQGIGVRKHKNALENVYNRKEIEPLFETWAANNPDHCDWRWMKQP